MSVASIYLWFNHVGDDGCCGLPDVQWTWVLWFAGGESKGREEEEERGEEERRGEEGGRGDEKKKEKETVQ